MTPALLQLSDVRKSFGAVRALKGVSFELRAGEVHALLGENGAGKSTLIKVITGAHQPDGGTIAIEGEAVEGLTPARAQALGISCIYQQPALFPDLTVAENIGLRLKRTKALARVRWVEQRAQAEALLRRIGANISVDAEVRALSMPEQQLVEIACALGSGARIVIMDEPTASLTQKEQHLLFAVVRELRTSGVGVVYISHRLEEIFTLADRVTILRDGESVGTYAVDELNEARMIQLMVGREVEQLYPPKAAVKDRPQAEGSVEFQHGDAVSVARPLASNAALDFMLLDALHVPQEIIRLIPADVARRYRALPVFHNDRGMLVVAVDDPLNFDTLSSVEAAVPSEVEFICTSKESLAAALLKYYGIAQDAPASMENLAGASAEVVLALRNFGCAAGGVQGVNLEIRAGEIVGLAGLVGAGRTELARTIFGLTPADAGEILLHGTRVQLRSPSEAIAQGIAYVPEDRRRHGVILEMPIAENMSMAIHPRLFPGGVLRFGAETANARQFIEELGIKAYGPSAPGGSLSGGNQQKVSVARWLATKPKVLVLDEPTQGVDVGAKSEIHKIVRRMAADGLAVLMISSDLPEILGMSDRIAVMRSGTLVAILPGSADAHTVMAAALGQGGKEAA